jgi:hypothetical protein
MGQALSEGAHGMFSGAMSSEDFGDKYTVHSTGFLVKIYTTTSVYPL